MSGIISIIGAILGSSVLTTILTRVFKKADDKKAESKDKANENNALIDAVRWMMCNTLTYLTAKYIAEAQADGSNSISPERHKKIREGNDIYRKIPRANGDMDELMKSFDMLTVDYNRKEMP